MPLRGVDCGAAGLDRRISSVLGHAACRAIGVFERVTVKTAQERRAQTGCPLFKGSLVHLGGIVLGLGLSKRRLGLSD